MLLSNCRACRTKGAYMYPIDNGETTCMCILQIEYYLYTISLQATKTELDHVIKSGFL